MIKDIQNIQDDIIDMKRKIKRKLIENPDIVEALHNTDIDEDSPDELLDTNIFGFIRIPHTQDTVRNFICVTIDDIEDHQSNTHMKIQYLKFTVISHLDDIKTPYGADRHDLLGFLVRDSFNWTDLFGLQFKMISNKESTIDGDYYCRTLIFESTQLNSLNKARRINPNDRS